MYKYLEIRAVHLELTERCQAACPMCSRTGNFLLTNSELSISDIRKIFSKNFVKQLNRITLCGNFGEPIVAKDCLNIVEYFRYSNPHLQITINTNAGARNLEFWSDLATILNGSNSYVVFGIDGLEDTNHVYRVGVNWNKVISSAKTFIDNGGNARWDFIVFEHNEYQIEEAKQLSQQLGFQSFRLKKTYRFEKFKNLNIRPSKKYFNEKTYIFSKNEFDSVEIDCLVKQSKEIYISAQGLLFPCCWVGEEIYNKNSIIDKNKIDLKKHTIQEIMNTDYFYDLENRWKLNSIKEGKPLVCAKQCGKNNNLLKSQY